MADDNKPADVAPEAAKPLGTPGDGGLDNDADAGNILAGVQDENPSNEVDRQRRHD